MRDPQGGALFVLHSAPAGDVGLLKRLAGKEYMNIATIYDVQARADGGVELLEEYFEGGETLREMMDEGEVEAGAFQDIVLQIHDALAFLAAQKPPISHNAIVPENILVNGENHTKLTNFTAATSDGYDVKDDIHMLGVLIGSVDKPYIKRYRKVLGKCMTRAYDSLEDLRKDINRQSKVFFGMSVGAFLILAAIVAVITGFARAGSLLRKLLSSYLKWFG